MTKFVTDGTIGLMKKHIDAFKRLRTVMKDVNGDNRQIIKTMQAQIDYLMEFIAVQGEIIEQATGHKQPKLSEEQKRRLAHRGKRLNESSIAVLFSRHGSWLVSGSDRGKVR